MIFVRSAIREQASSPSNEWEESGMCRTLALVFLVVYPGSARLRNLTHAWPARIVLGLVVVACLGALTGLSLTASGAFLPGTCFRLVTFFGRRYSIPLPDFSRHSTFCSAVSG
jgi:hypothetical protein